MSPAIDHRDHGRRVKSGRQLLGLICRIVVLLIIEGLVILALAAILPGVETPSFAAAVLVAATMALINAVLWPIVIRIALPLTVFTFGLGSLVFSAGTVALGFYVVDGTSIPIGGDLAIAFAMALVSMLIAPLLDVDGDAQHLRVVRRRVRQRTQGQPHRRPGRDPVRDRRPGRDDPAGGGARRARAHDRALAVRGHTQDPRLGVRSLLADGREPGGSAAGQQLGHARLPLV